MPVSYNIDLPIARSYSFEDFQFTYVLTTPNEAAAVAAGVGLTTLQAGDYVVGSALAMDTSTPRGVRLIAAGDKVFGRMETFTNRASAGINTCTVARKFIDRLPVDTGLVGAAIPVLGSTVEGSTTLGTVRAAAAINQNDNVVTAIEVDGVTGVTYAIVEKL